MQVLAPAATSRRCTCGRHRAGASIAGLGCIARPRLLRICTVPCLWTPWRRLLASVTALHLAGLVLASGCEQITSLFGGDDESAATDGAVDDDEPRPEKVAKAPPPIKKAVPILNPADLPPLKPAPRRLSVPTRVTPHLGFNLDQITGLQALAAAIEIPDWSVSGDDQVRAMRDDDLMTAWSCHPEAYRNCAIGFHLTAPAEIRAVRLYAAAPGKAFEQHARPAKVRVHTDLGWVTADIADGPGYAYVVFGKPVTSGTLIVEILSTHGRKKTDLFIAEVEVFGYGGAGREPLVLDPARMITEVDGEPWRKGRDGQIRGASFLESLDDDGSTRRMMPGTAIYGRAQDAIVLIEALASTDCRGHTGMFYLLNLNTRVPVAIGDLGGMGGQVFRSLDGLGFVAGFVDQVEARVTGLVLEGDEYKYRRSQRLAAVQGPAALDEWKIEREPMPRGGAPINRPAEACTLGSDDLVAQLRAATGGKPEGRPGEWMVCDLGDGARAFFTDHGPCGKSWEITILDKANKVVATKAAKRKGARLRTRRWTGLELLIELGGLDDVVELLHVTKSGMKSLGTRAFAASPPATCRTRCDDELTNNAMP